MLVNCEYCGGTGVYSDEEYEPVDCGCGGWSDVDLDEWYGDDE